MPPLRSLPFRFMHCADLHLGSPFRGLDGRLPAELAALLAEAPVAAFEATVAAAIERRAALLLIAGDVYDSTPVSLALLDRFHAALERAVAAGVRPFLVAGNHDPLDRWPSELALPEGVHLFGAEPERVVVELPGDSSGDRGAPGGRVAIVGVSHRAPGERRNLAAGLGELAAAHAGEGLYTIALLHANVGGRPEHDDYAPAAPADLDAPGVDYWALGHIHTPLLLRRGPAAGSGTPWAIYPGCLQGRGFGEQGPRGCLLGEVDAAGRCDLMPLAVDRARWATAEVDVSGLDDLDRVLAALRRQRDGLARAALDGGDADAGDADSGDRPVIGRLRLVGTSRLDPVLRRLDPAELIAPLNLDRRDQRDRRDRRDRHDRQDDGRTAATVCAATVWVAAVEVATAAPVDRPAPLHAETLADLAAAAERWRSRPDAAAEVRRLLLAHPAARSVAARLGRLDDGRLLRLVDGGEALAAAHLRAAAGIGTAPDGLLAEAGAADDG